QRSSESPGATKDAPLYRVALLKPLSPEQLGWALMQATGLTDNQRKALGAGANEATMYARLSPNLTPITNAFATPPGTPQTFDARVEQALFLANGPLIKDWVTQRPGSLTDRLTSSTTTDAIADEIYLSVFTRLPSADERKEVAAYLAGRTADRAKATQEI